MTQRIPGTNAYIPSVLDSLARVIAKSGLTGGPFARRALNFIEGSGVTITLTDDAGNEAVDVTISASGGGGSPTGAASGDLGGTYPGPTVTQARGIRETSGPTTLTVGAIADGQTLKRVGSTIVGAYVAIYALAPGAFNALVTPAGGTPFAGGTWA